MADAVVIAKTNSADPETVDGIAETIARLRPGIPVVRGASPIRLDDPEAVAGRRVLVVEDGPTITHGGMAFGAGYVATRDLAAEIVDPRAFATPEIAAVYERYPHIGPVLPAVGYSDAQRQELERTIAASGADAVVIATPIDLGALLRIDIPTVRVRYDYADAGEPTLAEVVDGFLAGAGLTGRKVAD
jgi:predicted GTPase